MAKLNRVKEKLNKIISNPISNKVVIGLLVATLCVGVCGSRVDALYDTNALGVSNIGNPEISNELAESTNSHIYFGSVPSDSEYDTDAQGNPISWRILNTTANDGTTPALFVVTDEALPVTKAWNAAGGQDWSTSDIKTFLQNTMYNGCFTTAEKSAIAAITKTETNQTTPYTGATFTGNPTGLTNETLFLLSMEELYNENYGFNNVSEEASNVAVASRGCLQAGEVTGADWWLRSGSSEGGNKIVVAKGDNTINTSDSTEELSVRVAMNIDLSSVLYTSLANRTAGTVALAAVANDAPTTEGPVTNSADASKLTLLDASRDGFSVTPTTLSIYAGDSITINYEGATASEKDYISVILKELSGDAVYYGSLQQVTNATGTVEVAIPANLTAGSYQLLVLNEEQNGECETNYAGYDEVTVEILDADSREGFLATTTSTELRPGDTITISYSGAQTGEGEYIAVLLYNSDGTVAYYGSVQAVDPSGSGTAEITLPEELSLDEEYTLRILNEQQNDTNIANLAGYSDITITITEETTPPDEPVVPTTQEEKINYYKLIVNDRQAIGLTKTEGGATIIRVLNHW